MTEQELLKLKKDIGFAKEEMLKLQGQQTGLLQQLKTDWNCTSIDQAKKKLAKLKEAYNTLSDELEVETAELEEQLNNEQFN